MTSNNIQLIKLRPEDDALNHLRQRLSILYDLRITLYSQPGCSCGGPLHVMLDDGNLRNSDLEHCAKSIWEEKWSDVRELCQAIIDMLRTLSPAQRMLWWGVASVEQVLAAEGKDIELTDKGYVVKD